MKKFWIIIVAIVALTFCGCSNTAQQFVLSPLKDVEIDDNSERYFLLYVCGAVQNEGYYTVKEGTTYAQVVHLAGVLPQTVLPDYSMHFVDGKTTVVSVGYRDNGTNCSCINVNGSAVKYRRNVNGISSEVINLLADYLDIHGKITDKKQLQQILGSLYQDNYFKFFVEVDDYEEVD